MSNIKFYKVETDSNSGGTSSKPLTTKRYAESLCLKKVEQGWPCVQFYDASECKLLREWVYGEETSQEDLNEYNNF